jgi:hypothetical protein
MRVMVAIDLILLFSVGMVGAQNPDLAAVFIDNNAWDELKIAIGQ